MGRSGSGRCLVVSTINKTYESVPASKSSCYDEYPEAWRLYALTGRLHLMAKQDTKIVDNGNEFFGEDDGSTTDVATTDAMAREVKMVAPGGVITPATIEDLKQLTFSDLASGGDLIAAEDAIGQDQFGAILDSSAKGKLCGVPLIVVFWEFHEGDMGGFVSLYVLTQADERFIVNDGSTGIYQQLRNYTDKTGVTSKLAVPGGFRMSEYDKDITLPNGEVKTTRAKTYYLEAGRRVSA